MTFFRTIVALLIGSLAASTARADIVERVVAVVNNDAIFLSDLRQRAVPFLPRVAEASSDTERAARLKELYEELLNFLIEEELIRQLARESGITATDSDVETAVANIRAQNNMTEEDFLEALQEQGMSEAQYRADLKKQLLRFKVVNERVRARVNVTEDEVRRRYEQRARGQGEEVRLKVSHLVVSVEPEASATETANIREEAETLRASLTPENFQEQAEPRGGGELGWLASTDLPSDFAETLDSMQAGEISQPVRGGSGFHIFYLEERKVGSDFPTYEEMKEELFREMLDSAMRRQERVFLEELRRNAVINRML